LLLVIDTNVVISFLVKGKLTSLVFSPMLNLVTVERLFVEIDRNKDEIRAKSSFSAEEIEVLLTLLKGKIMPVPMEQYISFMSKAEEILGGHKKDVPFLALALKLNCPVWSYEKRFKRIGDIESLTTAEVRAKLDKLLL